MNILKEREEKMEQNILKEYKNNQDIQKKLIKLIEHTVKD